MTLTITLPLILSIGLWLLCAVLGAAVGYWWLPRPAAVLDNPASVEAVESPLEARARELTAQAEAGPGGGEYKRHQVYAKLIKEFPAESRRLIAMAIEKGLP